MLRRLFGNLVPTIDKLIERIPPHIRDIIQKASIAFAALIALLVIISGINKGLREAKPAGYKLVERNRDLFYLQEMREEYAKKRQLVEDVEVDPLQFPSRQQAQDDTRFVTMGRETMGHLMGEKEEMLKHEDTMRPREKTPGYLGDRYTIPRITPDKKTFEDDEAPLTKEKIGSRPAALPASPGAQQTRERDVFDSPTISERSAPVKTTGSMETAGRATDRAASTPAQPGKKLEFMD